MPTGDALIFGILLAGLLVAEEEEQAIHPESFESGLFSLGLPVTENAEPPL